MELVSVEREWRRRYGVKLVAVVSRDADWSPIFHISYHILTLILYKILLIMVFLWFLGPWCGMRKKIKNSIYLVIFRF